MNMNLALAAPGACVCTCPRLPHFDPHVDRRPAPPAGARCAVPRAALPRVAAPRAASPAVMPAQRLALPLGRGTRLAIDDVLSGITLAAMAATGVAMAAGVALLLAG